MTDIQVAAGIFLALLLLLNIISFGLFWWDKRAARRRAHRIPERSLLKSALIGGSVGAKLAQRFFRHKTYKQPFAQRLNQICAVHVMLFAALIAAFAYRAIS